MSSIHKFLYLTSDAFRQFGSLVYRFGCPNSGVQKTHFKFYFFSCFSMKKRWSSNRWFYNASNNFELVRRQNWRQKRRKNCEIKRVQSERRNRPQKWFLSFKCVIHHVNVGFFLYINSLHCFIWFLIPSILLAASIQLRSLCSSNKFIAIQIFYLNILSFEKSSTKKIVSQCKVK